MGYEGQYTLTERCISEFVATWMFVFLLLSVLANKLLPKTKGHEIGFGWVALGIGLACFLPVQYFGYISSMVNPAMALANCIAEMIDWSDLLPIAVCQIAGAWLGGVTVWLFYLPHFATVPEPPPSKTSDELLRTRDYIGRSSLAYASYSTVKYEEVRSVLGGLKQFEKAIRGHRRPKRCYRDEDILGHDAVVGRSGLARRRSINTADLHGRLHRHRDEATETGDKSKPSRHHHHHHHRRETPPQQEETLVQWPMSSDEEEEEDDMKAPLLAKLPAPERQRLGERGGETTVAISDVENQGTVENTDKAHYNVSMNSLSALAHHDNQAGLYYEPGSDFVDSGPSGDETESLIDKKASLPVTSPNTGPNFQNSVTEFEDKEESNDLKKNEKSKRTDKLHEASIKADQNAKLAVFATRPANFIPVSNLINEIIGTCLLTSGILMLNQRGAMIWLGDKEVYMHGLKSFWVGILVVVLVLGLGGPGVALNPARDLGPRIAHWMLPIPGKGPSEWYYAWIPLVGTLIGGIFGGVFYNLCDMLNKSAVHRGYYDDTLSSLEELVEL